MIRQSYPLLLVIAVFFACQGTGTEDASEPINLELEVTDSVRIPYVGVLSFMDIQPEMDRALFFDLQKRSFVSTDLQGNILGQFSKDRDSPDGFGSFPMAAGRFLDQNRIQLVSMYGVFEYDLEGNLQRSAKTPKDEIKGFSGRMDAIREIKQVGDQLLLTGLLPRTEYSKTQPEFYDTFQQLVWVDPQSGRMEQFLGLDSASIFQNNRSHEPTTLSATFDIRDNELFVISGGDPYLNVYELEEPYKKLKRMPLELTDFQVNPGEDPQKADPRAISFDPSYGMISKLTIVGDYLLINYTTGYDDLDREEYQSIQSQEQWQVFNTRVGEKYKPRLQVLSLEGEKLLDIETPDRLGNVFVSRDGNLWFNVLPNPDVEEDFFQINKVEIKKAGINRL